MSYSRGWVNVEDGSSFELTVQGAANHTRRCVIDGIIVDCAPFPQTLNSPHRYQWYLTVRLGAGPATVSASMTKPSGKPHGKPYNQTLAGNAGDLAFVFLHAITQ